MKVRIGIVVAEFNKEITIPMLDEAKKFASVVPTSRITHICFVPGVFDMPIMIEELLKKRDVDAVVTLGAIIKGETSHDRLIGSITAKSITELSLKYKKPISLGITGPDMTFEQAEARIEPVSQHAIQTAVLMTKRLREIRNRKIKNKGTKPTLLVVD
ncbi:MAG: 6,7-dimethyl-8-ribityllumazine synthase [Candidatus Nitrosocosmicus sp.]|jgi:6,7-dimethyl-8-ribityllumazine synthase|uniref:6,7-dimethyl-8-ribityllumazine synthase n=1 Tax=Candidatus Nitrosocosmicus sp. FF01 TaxID=3397670 RepID=UPI002A6BA24C|nr:6,7-dimethyl-8-ribityllumazine synthase [Candidatus Nitrosocosmicus sp.]GKS61321.1 6,7-dimethyl-8-ribityllumazine synthase [Candidatus Nitrosocosmicus sp.]